MNRICCYNPEITCEWNQVMCLKRAIKNGCKYDKKHVL